jgi:hypothetical protein
VCTVELDKTGGIKVTVVDADTEAQQSIVMNGTQIVLSMSKDGQESTITQTEQKVLIQCAHFEVQAEETILLESQQGTIHRAGSTLELEATSDLTASSDSKVALSAPEFSAEGSVSAKIAGAQSKVELEASKAAVSSPAMLSLSGQAQAELSGALVNVKADGVAAIKGAVTNVQGNLVNLG